MKGTIKIYCTIKSVVVIIFTHFEHSSFNAVVCMYVIFLRHSQYLVPVVQGRLIDAAGVFSIKMMIQEGVGVLI